MKICDIIKREEYILSEVDDELDFSKLSIDPNEISNEDILIIPNSKKIPDLSKSKANPLAVICDKNAVLPEYISRILVNNVRLAMAKAYYRFHNLSLKKMKIIGITGTNGKTTTATLISRILASEGYKIGFIGTGKIEIDGSKITDENYSMTTPDPPLLFSSLKKMESHGCNAVVMEVSSHALALEKVAPIEFDYGVFTNLSPEHTDFHSDINSYFDAKLKLFSQSRCSVFNLDDDYGKRAYTLCSSKKISVGVLWHGDVWASNIENHGFDGISYTYHGDCFSFKMKLPLPGIYNAYNSMLAAAVCIDIGCKPCNVKRILSKMAPVEGRYEIINEEISVIIDYAHTATAFNNILRELSVVKGAHKLTVVFGCGGERDTAKRPKIAKIAEKYADRIIVTTDNSRNEDPNVIIKDICEGFEKEKHIIIRDREDAIKVSIAEAQEGDIVAIVGKGAEKYNIDKDGLHPFDERKIVLAALEKRKTP